MISVLHVLGPGCDETACQTLQMLCSRFSGDRARHAVCSMDGQTAVTAKRFLATDVRFTPARIWSALNWAPRLADAARDCSADVIHAWDIGAARLVSARLPDLPLVLSLADPGPARDFARWLRSFPKGAAVAVGNQTILSRLLAAGVAPERSVVIRGAVDFKAINQARAAASRAPSSERAGPSLLLAGPPSEAGGQYYGVWAAAILSLVVPGLRVTLPYDNRESRRVRRFAESIQMPSLVVVPDPRSRWADLVAGADVFLVPAVGDVCTEPIGWAMAAGLPIVGSAVRCVAELIADRSNGLLCKPRRPRLLAARLLTAIEDAGLRTRVGGVARGQAYEVFGIRRFADNFARLYDNVLSGRLPGDGIRDAAMVA